jgi:MFS family permease
MSALEAANSFTPFAIAVLIASLYASRRVGERRGTFLAVGMTCIVVALATLVTTLALAPDGDIRHVVLAALSVYGLGQGLLSPVMYSTVLSGVPLRSAGAASGVLSTCQQVSAALGVGVIGLVFASVLGSRTGAQAHANAAAWALSINLATMTTAAVLAMRLPRVVTVKRAETFEV